MESVTNVVFRKVVAKAQRPDVFFTEFTNAKSFTNLKARETLEKRLYKDNDESPIIAQIWGNDPYSFKEISGEIQRRQYDGIDINTGCPDKSVIKQGAGSALIGNDILVKDLIDAAREGSNGNLPVSVKTRLGIYSIDEWKEWIAFLLEQKLPCLTIHLRTRKEMSKVPAHYELINSIKQMRDQISPSTLIMINGDVDNKEAGDKLYSQYGMDGIMIGRGVFKNPYAFSNYEPTLKELIDLFSYHLDTFDKYTKIIGQLPFDPMKHFVKVYVKDFDGASEIRQILMNAKTTDDMRQIVKNINF